MRSGTLGARPKTWWINSLISVGITLFLTACATPAPVSSPAVGQLPQPGSPKRITLAIGSEPKTLYTKSAAGTSGFPGIGELEGLVLSGLVVPDHESVLRPQLAEAVPSVENGLWRVLPDGRMETVWHIRPAAQWHDGTLFTAEDLRFTFKVASDRDLPSFRDSAYDNVESVEAPDPRSVLVRWKRPFLKADVMWSSESGLALPLPRHLLESAYTERKDNFTDLPFWFEEFVGTGAFKLRDITRGSHLTLEAFDGYVLGRPKIDTIEVRFIPDTSTLVANVLAGEVELTLGRTLSLDQAVQVRDRWRDGKVDIKTFNADWVISQLLNPDPSVIGNAQFRRALLYAMDRQQIIDSFQAGLTSVPHAYVRPESAAEREFEPIVMRYDYNPRRAMELIDSLGYTRGSDGFYRDPAGRLSVEIRTTATEDIQVKELSAIADGWQRVGVAVDSLLVSQQRNQDRADRANRPGFLVTGGPGHLDVVLRNYSRDATLPENNYAGGNQSRYMNSDYDALYERYVATIPRAERMQLAGQLLRHMSENLPDMIIMYRMLSMPISNRLINITAVPRNSAPSWNAHEWDAQPR